jgi:hypothetical protein
VLTAGFTKAAEMRAKVLGLPTHPRVIVDHPLASKTEAEVLKMAEDAVEIIAKALTEQPAAAAE